MNLYLDNIIDLYKHPLNQGFLKNPSASHRAFSPLCGDDITVDLFIESNRVQDIRHRGNGCAISQASISLLTEEAKGKSLDELLQIPPEYIVEMLGVELGPVRLKCALLSLEALHKAIQSYYNNHIHGH
ncbi:MAG: iron-sulfur cluster assembly scaffold protein [bacterium]|nr:iron-sulfur cluster assembly scaffold protein [bacterium]